MENKQTLQAFDESDLKDLMGIFANITKVILALESKIKAVEYATTNNIEYIKVLDLKIEELEATKLDKVDK